MSKHETDVKTTLDHFEKTQWNYRPDPKQIENYPIITREDLRNTRMKKGLFSCSTSGSTGESLSVEKTYGDYIWYISTNIREFRWRKWDVTKNFALIRPDAKKEDANSWGIPYNVEPIQGQTFKINYESISTIQSWLEEKNPHYIHARPSIIKELNLSKITNLIDTKGTGELGGSMFSSEECGTIAITCPDNPSVYHVMENQIVEVDTDGGMIITTLTNPYIRRYKNGDCIELGECTCGRSLQTITKINGRIRNMFVLPNGDKKWALFGSLSYYKDFGIKKYKLIQTSLTDLELHIISEPLGEREEELKKHVLKFLDSPINITIKYVENFTNYKFEEFICMLTNKLN